MNSVRLYYIKHQGEKDLAQIDTATVDRWLAELSTHKQSAVCRLINNKDQITSLLGLQLLKRCAADEQIADFRLSDVQYPENGKPLWKGGSKKEEHKKEGHNETFDFNISHSENLVIIAVSKSIRIGIDAEKIKPLKRLNFKMVMLPDELDTIHKAPLKFFELWSKKEAVVKAANTSGLSQMRDVILKDDCATFESTTWYLKKITLPDIEHEYSVQLAVSENVENIIIKQIKLSDVS